MIILACLLVFHSLFHSFAYALQLPRGVPTAKVSFYKPGSTFLCLDGSATIPWTRVNDDYCDCRDGSDEPGTSACPNGHFHCRDMKYMVVSLPSGYVNDNVCDCCDGSDEYENRVSCPSACSKLAAALKEAQSIKRSQIEKGHKIFRDYVAQLKERKEQQRIADEKAALEKQTAEESQESPTSPSSEDHTPPSQEEHEPSPPHPHEEHRPEAEYPNIEIGKVPDGGVGDDGDLSDHDHKPLESDDQHEEPSDGAFDDSPTIPDPPVPPTPIDYGPEEGFRMLTELPDECLEFHNQEYTYTLCPFKNVSQRDRDSSKTSHGTSLGRWDQWIQLDGSDTEKKYEIMYYSNGLGCWNGPDRSTKVFVHCGEKNEIISVNEPSRCEYTFDITTPAACYEDPEVVLSRLNLDEM